MTQQCYTEHCELPRSVGCVGQDALGCQERGEGCLYPSISREESRKPSYVIVLPYMEMFLVLTLVPRQSTHVLNGAD